MDARVQSAKEDLAKHAPAVAPLASDEILRLALSRPLSHATTEVVLRESFATARESRDPAALKRALRRARHAEIVRVALREVRAVADIDQTSRELALIASQAIDCALSVSTREVFARRGRPVHTSTREHVVDQVVLGMGKLGGGELNLGSDVDIAFFYETDDAEVLLDGEVQHDITPHEVFTRIARATTRALDEVTEDGFAYRVDLRLRPEGTRGPLVNSLASAERYYFTFGRTWERAALLRAGPIAGNPALGESLLSALQPFIYRRAVEPAVADALRSLVLRAQRAAHPRDVKLTRGGIREAEFFVQSLQLIWGGQHPSLQLRGTIEALKRLGSSGLVSSGDVEQLAADWAFLRAVEHRVHLRQSYQTHIVPDGASLEAMAASLGFENGSAFEDALDATRERVASLYDSLAEEERASAPREDLELTALIERVVEGASADELRDEVQRVLPVDDKDAAASHLVRLARRAESPLGPLGRARCPKLGEKLLAEIRLAADPDRALLHCADLFRRVGFHGGYDRLLDSDPRTLCRLVALFGSSDTLASALIAHPEALGELLIDRPIADPHETHRALPLTLDQEEFTSRLRRLKREFTLSVGLAFSAADRDRLECEAALTALAEAQIQRAFDYVYEQVTARRGAPADDARLCVVAMGKLGGRELSFGSDLDLIFVYDRDGDNGAISNQELFTQIAQRLMRVLSHADQEGPGYTVDARLRPSGSRGVLVTSFAAFNRYHSRDAKPWERQALIRARPVAGASDLFAEVEALTQRSAFRDPAPAEDLAHMRARMQRELAGENASLYHPKLGYGGLVDVEFWVQWHQMRFGSNEDVRPRHTLEALRALAPYIDAGDADILARGHAFFRDVEQALSLLSDRHSAKLSLGGRVAHRVARRLGIRERHRESAADSLAKTWREHATSVRSVFERTIASVGVPAPWSPS